MNRIAQAWMRFGRNCSGAAAAEFALVSVIFLTMLLGILDMARFAWEFNSEKAAARAGARYAVVSQPAVQELISFDAVSKCGIAGGEFIPNGTVSDFTCTSTGCTASGAGSCLSSGTLNSTNFNAIVARMQGYDPRISASNVTVKYAERGMGMSGNPFGTDVSPLVTVSLRNVTFSPIALKMFGVTLNLPSVSTTFTAEDLG